jgi:hypothetical protein
MFRPRRKRFAPPPLEKAVQAAAVEHWQKLGLPDTLVAAIPNAGALGQPGLTKGLADLFVLAPGLPIGFIELKREPNSPLSDEQLRFGALCVKLKIPYAVAVGRDEPIDVLEEWSVVRRAAA